MQPEEMTRLVEQVTSEVLRALGQTCPQELTGGSEGLALVLGDPNKLPKALFHRLTPVSIDDYIANKCITRYQQVIIQEMTTLQLAQLALGMPADDFGRAVMDALLSGVEVYYCEACLWHRRMAGKGSIALYQLLESYVQKLQVFGVKPLTKAVALEKPASFAPPVPEAQRSDVKQYKTNAQPNVDKLVTEKQAQALCHQANGSICLPKGTLITPAARDVFAAAGVTVIIEK